jgi:hypothetical protein
VSGGGLLVAMVTRLVAVDDESAKRSRFESKTIRATRGQQDIKAGNLKLQIISPVHTKGDYAVVEER